MSTLTLYWPEPRHTWPLQHMSCVRFTPNDGGFSSHQDSETKNHFVLFKQTPEGIEFTNYAYEQSVYVDGKVLPFGGKRSLELGNIIQIERFSIAIEEDSDGLQQLPEGQEILLGGSLPELDDILRNSFLHVTAGLEETERNVLKTLEKEFRQALIWGIQNIQHSQNRASHDSRIAENTLDFDSIYARVKAESVTQCIFESSMLIHRIFDEMNLREDDMLKPDESERSDILRLLASEEISYDIKKRIPALLVQDIYRADLDTLL